MPFPNRSGLGFSQYIMYTIVATPQAFGLDFNLLDIWHRYIAKGFCSLVWRERLEWLRMLAYREVSFTNSTAFIMPCTLTLQYYLYTWPQRTSERDLGDFSSTAQSDGVRRAKKYHGTRSIFGRKTKHREVPTMSPAHALMEHQNQEAVERYSGSRT